MVREPVKITFTLALPAIGSFLLAFPLAAYLAFALYRIDVPGLQYDESLFINAALGNLDGSFVTYRLPIFGHDIVLMCMPYIGALKSWIWSPIFNLFGVSAITVRLPAVMVGAGAIALTFLYLRRIFDRNVAILAASLLSLDPSFIFGTRLDWGPIALMSLLKAAVLYFGFRAWTERSWRLSTATGLFMGLGIFDKTNFGWLLIAIIISLAVCYPRELLPKVRLLGPPFAFGLCVAIIPLAVFNIAVPFGTLSGQFDKHAPFFEALVQRFGVLHSVLDGEAVINLVSSGQIGGHFQAYQAPETAVWVAFEVSLVALLIVGLARRKLERRIVFFLSLLASIFVLIILTPNAYGPHHALFTYPFPHIVIAYAFVRVAYLIRDQVVFLQRYAFGVLAFFLIAITGSEAIADSAYIGNFTSTGGAGAWSDKIYVLEQLLPKKSGARVALMDWGFDTQLNGLSHDGILHDEDFWDLWQPNATDTDERIAGIVRKNKVFVFHSAMFPNFPLVRERFDAYLKRHHIKATVREIRQEDGVPVYDVVTLGAYVLSGSAELTAPLVSAPAEGNVGGVSFTADPVELSSGQTVGTTTLHWATPYNSISIFVGKKDGTLFTNSAGVGFASTGQWATDGMKFFLERESRPGDPKSFVTIAIVTAHTN